MTNPEQKMDAYDERLIEQLMDEGGPDPEMLQTHRRAVQTTFEEGDTSKEEKKSLKGEDGTVGFGG